MIGTQIWEAISASNDQKGTIADDDNDAISFSSLVPDEWLQLSSSLTRIARRQTTPPLEYKNSNNPYQDTQRLALHILDDLQPAQDDFLRQSE